MGLEPDILEKIAAKRHREMLKALDELKEVFHPEPHDETELKELLRVSGQATEIFLSKIREIAKPEIIVQGNGAEIVNSLRGISEQIIVSNKSVEEVIERLLTKLTAGRTFEMNIEIDGWTQRIKKITGFIK